MASVDFSLFYFTYNRYPEGLNYRSCRNAADLTGWSTNINMLGFRPNSQIGFLSFSVYALRSLNCYPTF